MPNGLLRHLFEWLINGGHTVAVGKRQIVGVIADHAHVMRDGDALLVQPGKDLLLLLHAAGHDNGRGRRWALEQNVQPVRHCHRKLQARQA